MTKRQRQILERLHTEGDLSEADLKTSNAYMVASFYWAEPRLADGYFHAGRTPNVPQHRWWSITKAGRKAIAD